jgi:hypothetical protein
MGACSFTTSAYGKSMSNAYNNAVADAVSEYGTDAYNGTISTTNGYKDVTSEYKRSGKDIRNFISDNIEKCQKWGDAWGVCVEEPITNNGKIKSQVEHIVSKGTKKWVLVYVVESLREDRIIGKYKTKTEAVKKAREYTERTQYSANIYMSKELEKGTSQVAKVTYKQATNEKKGKYVFFGFAAE